MKVALWLYSVGQALVFEVVWRTTEMSKKTKKKEKNKRTSNTQHFLLVVGARRRVLC